MSIPRSEYPRPQVVREGWMNLNGQWQFEIDQGRSGEVRGLHKEGVALSGEITVPFCPESTLSGIGRPVEPGSYLFYRRSLFMPEAFSNGRVLLHIGAADQIADIYVNRKHIFIFSA